MKRTALTLALALASLPAFAQTSPAGQTGSQSQSSSQQSTTDQSTTQTNKGKHRKTRKKSKTTTSSSNEAHRHGQYRGGWFDRHRHPAQHAQAPQIFFIDRHHDPRQHQY